MMKPFYHICCLASVASLAACSTTQVHYHTLLAPAEAEARSEKDSPFLIELLPVGIPVQLDQAQLLVRQGNSSVEVLDSERWAGPLGDEIRAAVDARLAHHLGAQNVAGLARSAGKPLLRVKLQVRRLDAWLGQSTQLEADWSIGIADEAGNARLNCRGLFNAPAAGSYMQLVQAQQRLIDQLASRIADDARAWAHTRSSPCSSIVASKVP